MSSGKDDTKREAASQLGTSTVYSKATTHSGLERDQMHDYTEQRVDTKGESTAQIAEDIAEDNSSELSMALKTLFTTQTRHTRYTETSR